MVRADPVDPPVGFSVFVNELDSLVDNQEVSHRARRELKAGSDLHERSAFELRD